MFKVLCSDISLRLTFSLDCGLLLLLLLLFLLLLLNSLLFLSLLLLRRRRTLESIAIVLVVDLANKLLEASVGIWLFLWRSAKDKGAHVLVDACVG